ncbi:MAG: TonB-dependent receptor [Bacteroidota bacterium]
MRRNLLVFICLWSLCILSVMGQHSIKGIVKDQGGAPLEGAAIELLNSSLGAIADAKGEFQLMNVPEGVQVLKVSIIGHAIQTQTINVPIEDLIQFELPESFQELAPVVVTATKREVNAQDVPSAISSIDASGVLDLQIDNINDVGKAIPNFNTYDDGGSIFPLVSVRGIATISDVPIVGIYVDDIPLFNTASFPAVLQNLDRIEVLRGPQGTLYGRNSLGGVINIITKQPTNKTQGHITLGYGNLNQLQVNGSVSTPLLKDKLFLGLDGSFSSRDGYIRNTFLDHTELLGNEMATGNIRLSWLMNDKWSLTLRTGIESRDIDAYALVGAIGNTGAQLDSLRENHPYELDYNTEGNYISTLTNSALKLSYYGDKIFFKAISALQTTSLEIRGEEFDFSRFDITESNTNRDILTFSEELRIGSNQNDSRFNWLAGAFFYYYQYDNRGGFTNGADNAFFAPSPEVAEIYPYIQRQSSLLKQTGISLYANADYALTDNLTFTAGLRYEIEDSESDNTTTYSQRGNEDFSFPPLGLIPAEFGAEAEFSALSPKASLSYKISSDQMIYGSVARGYRPGGINAFTTEGNGLTYDPEFTWNYELGLKSTFLENKMRLNLTAFYIDYTDQQLFTLVDITTFNLGNENIGKSISYGLELEWDYLLFKGFQASANVGYLETEIKEFSVVGFAGEVDNAGNTNAFAPTWSGNISLAYNTKIQDVQLGIFADYQFQTEMWLDPENVYSQPGYGLFNGRITGTYKGIELAVWAQNLADVVYFSYGYSVQGFGGFASYGLPRTVGTSLTYRF